MATIVSGSESLPHTASVYVYGVTWADGAPPLRRRGIGGSTVEIVEEGELAALVSPASEVPVRARRRDLMLHMDVLQSAFASNTVLPLRFGSVCDAGDVTRGLLGERYEELVELLHRFEGLAELRLRAAYPEDVILAEIVRGDRRVARLRELASSGGRDAYPLQVELGEAVAKSLAAVRERDADAITAALRGLARDMVVEGPATEVELLRASYLVERRQIDAFDRELDELASHQQGRINFKYTGPLPPHSFVALTHGRR